MSGDASMLGESSTDTARASPGRVYIIAGVRVNFPKNAYPSQLAMMAKVIQGIQRGQNSLIESPTGSGKTLALLCSTIAWQRMEAERLKVLAQVERHQEIKEMREKLRNKMEKAKENEKKEEIEKDRRKRAAEEELSSPILKRDSSQSNRQVKYLNDSDDDDDDFITLANSKQSKLKDMQRKINEESFTSVKDLEDIGEGAGDIRITILDENDGYKSTNEEDESIVTEDQLNDLAEMVVPPPKIRTPRIYFGTRTHKQIEQIVRELKKTVYKDIRMTILSSREHTCLQKKPRHMSSKTELCRELLEQAEKKDGRGCMYHHNVKIMANHKSLKCNGLPTPWDIEDLMKVGKRSRCCPYFTARDLMASSEIIFCPYNYLINPLIRKSMDIQLRGEIVILDEAHNMEDAAREAASFSVDQDTILDAMNDCEKTQAVSQLPGSYSALARFLSFLSSWMDQSKDTINDYRDYNQASQVWTGTQICAIFNNLGVGQEEFMELQKHLEQVISAAAAKFTGEDDFGDEEASAAQNQSMTNSTRSTLDGLFLTLNFIIGEGNHRRDDFRIALIRSIARDSQGPVESAGGWMESKSKSYSRWKLTLNFWCLNAAVAFTEISDSSRSIILTSGTLAPVGSFQSELGTPFPVRLEANHVIDKSQVFIATVGMGPNNYNLNATYRNTETFSFQDELGSVVLEICSIVPHGVLCFIPSYNLLDKLISRWQATGLYERLSSHKIILYEQRGRGGDEFEHTLRNFYEAVEMTSEADDSSPTGPLLLAVCRGKVSEGLDFADNNARAVISVGIPYPNFKDTQVELKRHFNDAHCSNRGLLSGSEWYEIQAYRALNQALGRCIRHRNDWGAIILIDDRFSRNKKYTEGLSKWIKNMVNHFPTWKNMYDGLNEFMLKQKKSVREF